MDAEREREGDEQIRRIVDFIQEKRKRESMSNMRAKVKCESSNLRETFDEVIFKAVVKSGSYPADGLDEDNTFAKFSPTAEFKITIANPALLGKFRPGQKFYVDFTEVEQ